MRPVEIKDLHGVEAARSHLLQLNNANSVETSLLTRDRFDQLVAIARVAVFIEPDAAFLLAFEHSDQFDGGHFQWFRNRYDKFLYIDRVVVAETQRRHGLGRLLYADLVQRAAQLGHSKIVCEVNVEPPNPISAKFHAANGFLEVGTATFDDGAKTVRYLLRQQ